MTKYLLDTHILIWWSENNKKLNSIHREILVNGDNVIFVSVASVWEIVIKTKAKKIKLKTPIERIISRYNFSVMDITFDHVLKLRELPNIHNDPFDRILIAQSKVEGLQLLTSDKVISMYFKK